MDDLMELALTGGASKPPSAAEFAQLVANTKNPNPQPVLVRVEALGKTIAELDNAVSELIGRIKPVLTPVVPSAQPPGCGAAASKAAQSPVGDRIEQLTRAVASTTKAVNDAIKRVEV